MGQHLLSPCKGSVVAAGFTVERLCAKPDAVSSVEGFLVFSFLFFPVLLRNVLEGVQVVKKGKPNSRKEKMLCHKRTTNRKILGICHEGVK